jgi:tyrosine-specific transport protein
MVKRMNNLIGTGALLLGASSLPSSSTAFSYTPAKNSVRTPQQNPFTIPRQQRNTNTRMDSKRVASPYSTSKSILNVGFVQEDHKNPPQGLKRDHPLKAAVVGSEYNQEQSDQTFGESFLFPVLSAAMLITGNTVGAGCLVLPDIAAGPGLATTSGIFFAAYTINLLSGLVLAEVAIKQKEASCADVPSSFKEFAETSLDSPLAANVISGISMFVNACVLTFDLSRAGSVGSGVLDGLLDPNVVTLGWASVLVAVVATQSSARLGNVASMFVTALFISFAGLLLPGLAGVHDPVATLMQPGVSPDWMASVGHAAPIILMSTIYQNIVPSIAKILDYDRVKTVSSIVVGSLVPLLMYLAWCYACLGGGIDRSVGIGGGELMAMFSIACLGGSSMGSIMSLAEEVDNFVKPILAGDNDSSNNSGATMEASNQGFQLPSVLLSVALPLTAALICTGGDDITGVLSLAGSFGSPLLYGAVPAVMALHQREKSTGLGGQQQDLVPGFSLGVLGVASSGFIGEELLQRVGDVMAFAH